jgi:uncharacterized protein (TIGR02145 family)
MKKTKLLLGIIPVFLFSSSILVLKAQIPAAIDTKMKSDNMRNFQVEEIKVRWKKAALENCPGVPCVVAPPAPSFTCGTSTVTDVDDNIYNTVVIGTGATAQCWTASNLKVTKYSDGVTPIPDQTSISPGTDWGTLQTGARTDYFGATGIFGAVPSGQTYFSTYGYLYNWFAVKGIFTTGVIASTDTLNICPLGWHVPTDAEWTTLETYLNTVAPTGSVGGKMKSTSSLWTPLNTGADNSSGFSALPGGYRGADGIFYLIRDRAFFWSASEFDVSPVLARYRYLETGSGDVGLNPVIPKSFGASVRCLRD